MTHAELQSNVISVNVGQHVHIILISPMQKCEPLLPGKLMDHYIFL